MIETALDYFIGSLTGPVDIPGPDVYPKSDYTHYGVAGANRMGKVNTAVWNNHQTYFIDQNIPDEMAGQLNDMTPGYRAAIEKGYYARRAHANVHQNNEWRLSQFSRDVYTRKPESSMEFADGVILSNMVKPRQSNVHNSLWQRR